MIEPRYGVLQTLFADRVFRIPHYQRFYSWQKRQRDDLFSDLTRLAKDDADRHHFMATIVCHRTQETKDVGASQYRIYDIVDGQQRLTTLILLLKSIELALPETSEDRTELAKTLVKRDGHLILLQTNNANEFNFNRFIRDGVAPGKTEIATHADRNLANAIRECRQFVETWSGSREILSLMRLVLHRLGFVVFDTEDSQVVYTIFEVLNSRGLAVDWLDKTKSVLMGQAYELSASPLAAEAEIQTLQGIWGKMYNEIAKEDVPGDEILRITATLYYGPGQGKPRSAEESLDLLRKGCDSFEKPRKISMQLLDVAQKLVELYASPHLGPVTEILHARLLAVAINSAKGVSDAERKKLLEQWERVTFRIFGLFGKDSRTKVGDYVRLAAKIVAEDIDTRTYNEIMSGLRELGSEYVIEQALEAGVTGKDYYTRPDECRYMLWSYEEHLAQKQGLGATVNENERRAIWERRASDSIEHILPQQPAGTHWIEKLNGQPVEPNVNRIGNLLLLPISLNQEAQRLPFGADERTLDTKKKIYAKHNIRMAKEVCEHHDWTITDIDVREKRIVDWAKTRWCDL
jgi:Protein of unknown function DUF262/Protein of unknown function (DUF1524)